MNDEALRYPNGRFTPQPAYSPEELNVCIRRIEALPTSVEKMIGNFSPKHFETPYRDGGWTGRQVVHHLADSHTNAYIRFKWTLTENTPTIKAYDEKLWAETPEVRLDPVISLNLLKALHVKWVALLRSLTTADLQKEYIHPDTKNNIGLDRMVATYAWHGDHHLGHLKIIAEKLS
jgi:hypothetical protein